MFSLLHVPGMPELRYSETSDTPNVAQTSQGQQLYCLVTALAITQR
jgi:hypothetical protein